MWLLETYAIPAGIFVSQSLWGESKESGNPIQKWLLTVSKRIVGSRYNPFSGVSPYKSICFSYATAQPFKPTQQPTMLLQADMQLTVYQCPALPDTAEILAHSYNPLCFEPHREATRTLGTFCLCESKSRAQQQTRNLSPLMNVLLLQKGQWSYIHPTAFPDPCSFFKVSIAVWLGSKLHVSTSCYKTATWN